MCKHQTFPPIDAGIRAARVHDLAAERLRRRRPQPTLVSPMTGTIQLEGRVEGDRIIITLPRNDDWTPPSGAPAAAMPLAA